MSDPTRIERELQEFLDGRLDEASRQRFEKRLDADPDLARRVEAARTVRVGLREAPTPELSEAFYRRARSRFEERGTGRLAGWRWISWETAGLAAAAVLAAAIFLPSVMREGVPGRNEALQDAAPEGVAPGIVRDVAPGAAGEAMPPASGAPADEFAPAPATGREPAVEAELESRDAPTRAEALRAAETPKIASDAHLDDVSGGKEQAAAAREAGESTGRSAARKRATSPPPPAPAPVEKSRSVEIAQSTVAAESTEADTTGDARTNRRQERGLYEEKQKAGFAAEPNEALAKDEDAAPSRVATTVVALRAAEIEPGSVVIERADAGADATADAGAGARADAAGPEAQTEARWRLVRIGARPGLSCAQLVVVLENDAYRLRSRQVAGEPAPHGCALTLPDDGRPVLDELGPPTD